MASDLESASLSNQVQAVAEPRTQERLSAREAASTSFAAKFADGSRKVFGPSEPVFEIQVATPEHLEKLLSGNPYSTAMAFVRNEFFITGDFAAAIRYHRSLRGAHLGDRLRMALAYLGRTGSEILFPARVRAALHVRYHYDLPVDFYKQFLDSRLVYSCAYFRSPEDSIEHAQCAKLDLICRKLDLHEGETFLDVGCGWGALVLHAAEQFGAAATGCTLSRQQFEYANRLRDIHPSTGDSTFLMSDYRELGGRFHKIASVGMFEHIGRGHLKEYFEKLFALLSPGGLLLNHGIMRPAYSRVSPETDFLRKRVFPGSHLYALDEVIRCAEEARFEVLDVENLRPHYALTLRAWVRNLQERAAECSRIAGEAAYRSWLIAFAASEANFAEGYMNVHQVLLQKPGAPGSRRLTRSYMAAP